MVGLLSLALLSVGWGCGRARYDGGPDTGMDAPRGDAPFASDDAGEDGPVPDAFLTEDAFRSADASITIDAVVPADAPMPDAFSPPDASMPDALVLRDAPAGPDAASDPACDAVLADPVAAPDDAVFGCAVRGQLGRCSVYAAFGCAGGCACNYYVQNPGWDCPAACPTDLIRTGCVEFVGGGLLYPPAPVACGASTTAEQLVACTMRHEILAGHCGACVCP